MPALEAPRMTALVARVEALDIPLKHPFTIARGTESMAHTAILRVAYHGHEGLGEAAPSARYHESVESVLAWFRTHALTADDPYLLDALLDPLPPAPRCALDAALHDLIGKDTQRPVYRLLGLDPANAPVTSFTIGIAPIDEMLAKTREVGAHPCIKVKLGTGSEIDTLAAIRTVYTGAIRIDANEGWDAERAVRLLGELERFDIEFCEQPIPAGTPEQLRFIRERTRIPIVADEDAKDARDLFALAGCVDGINVKLVKCGGIRGGLRMIHTARALGMKVMLGCMVESAILSTAAAHLSPLVDWADLDGPFLTSGDPFTGITYDAGKIVLPNAPGLGITEASVLA